MTHTFDLCVVGGGPAGYTGAIRAAQLGLSVALVEKDAPGGVCLNCGCIPTKTLLASADALRMARRAGKFGVRIEGEITVDYPAMLQRKDAVVAKLAGGVAALLKANKVTYFTGVAAFTSPRTLEITGTGEAVEAKEFLLAPGSVPVHPGWIPAHPRILDSTAMLALPELPKKLAILGGGVIGCEFASLFASLGVEVTVIEMLDTLLPQADPDCVKLLTRRLKTDGVKIHTSTRLEEVKPGENDVFLKAGEREITADYLLLAIGRKPNTALLNLPAAGVGCDRHGFIEVDESFRTSAPHIRAVGDATARYPMLAHYASASALAAVENSVKNTPVPLRIGGIGCIFTHPEIASAGLTEAECEAQGIKCQVGKFPLAGLGKALAADETEGFIKVIADAATDRVLGIHAAGTHVSDIVGPVGAMLERGVTARELGAAVWPHPTICEGVMEALHALHGECIHAVNRKVEK